MGKEGPLPKRMIPPKECQPLRRWPRFRQPWRAWPSQNRLEPVEPVTMVSRLQDVAGRAIASALLPAPGSEHACLAGWIPTIITCMCLYIYIYIHTHTHTYIHTCIHTYIHVYMSYTYTHTHTYIYIHIHTYIHTYIHTSTYLSIYKGI